MLAGKVPALLADEQPPYKGGDRIILEWMRTRAADLPTSVRYPHKWITVTKIGRVGDGYLTTYATLERGSLYLRRGGGTTPDRLQSIDREVEYEPSEISPDDVAANTMSQVKRRIEGRLAAQVRRLESGSPATRRRMIEVMAHTQAKLDELDERAA
jgi:hypothetical protein